MTNDRLPQAAVDVDHALEASNEKANEKLAKHRWHWTLDESNKERVTIRAYARAVGRAESVIRRTVNGYIAWAAADDGRSLSEEIERAKAGVEQSAAIDAVAKRRGLSFAYVRQTRGDEVRAVRHAARDAAETKGTDVTDEIPRVAKFFVDAEESDRKAEVEKKEAHSLRYVTVSKHLLSALRAVKAALKEATDVPFDDEERGLLLDDVRIVREALALVDSRIAGNAAIDWDTELEKILKGATA